MAVPSGIFASGPVDPAIGVVAGPRIGAPMRDRRCRGARRRMAIPSSGGNAGRRRERIVGLRRFASGVPRSAPRGARAGADPVSRGDGGRGRSVPPRLDPEIVGMGALIPGWSGAGSKSPEGEHRRPTSPVFVESIRSAIAAHRNDGSEPGIGVAIPVRGPWCPSSGLVARMVLSRSASPMRDRRNDTCSEA